MASRQGAPSFALIRSRALCSSNFSCFLAMALRLSCSTQETDESMLDVTLRRLVPRRAGGASIPVNTNLGASHHCCQPRLHAFFMAPRQRAILGALLLLLLCLLT